MRRGRQEKRSPDGATALVARLDRWMRDNRAEYFRELAEGAAAKDVAALEKKAGQPLPPVLKALLGWRGAGDGRLQDNYALMSVREIAAMRSAMGKLLDAGEFDGPSWWRKDWIPFLDNGAGDAVCVDLGGSFGGLPGQLLEFRHDDEGRTVMYPSIEAWLQVFVETLEAGAWEEEDGGNFTADAAALGKVRARICPGYPKDHSADEGRAAAKAPAKKTKAQGEIVGQMTEASAKRLLDAWCARWGLTGRKEALRERPAGFQAIARSSEIVYDPDRRAVFVIRDMGPAFGAKDPHPVWTDLLEKERTRLAAAQPLGTIEVRKSRFREEVDEDDRPAFLLVREFGDPSITDEKFIESLRAFSKVFRPDWALKFGWAVSAEMKKRGLTE